MLWVVVFSTFRRGEICASSSTHTPYENSHQQMVHNIGLYLEEAGPHTSECTKSSTPFLLASLTLNFPLCCLAKMQANWLVREGRLGQGLFVCPRPG